MIITQRNCQVSLWPCYHINIQIWSRNRSLGLCIYSAKVIPRYSWAISAPNVMLTPTITFHPLAYQIFSILSLKTIQRFVPLVWGTVANTYNTLKQKDIVAHLNLKWVIPYFQWSLVLDFPTRGNILFTSSTLESLKI